jgi:DnaJ-class molecular chaperone
MFTDNMFHDDMFHDGMFYEEEEEAHELDVTLEDLYNGRKVKFSLERHIVCSLCHG